MLDVKKSWNKIARLYSQKYLIKTNTIHYGPLCPGEYKLRLLGDISGFKVIDLGCGAGQNAAALAKAGAVVTGVDFADNQLEEARKLADRLNIPVELINSDISNLAALNNNDFDIAISVCAMAFVKDLKRALTETFRILKSKGRFILSVMHPVQYIIDGEEGSAYFNSAYPFAPRLLKWNWEFESKSVKFQHYLRSVSEYHNCLTEAGFEVRRILEPKPTLKTPHLGFSREIMKEYPYIARHLPITLIFLAVKP